MSLSLKEVCRVLIWSSDEKGVLNDVYELLLINRIYVSGADQLLKETVALYSPLFLSPSFVAFQSKLIFQNLNVDRYLLNSFIVFSHNE